MIEWYLRLFKLSILDFGLPEEVPYDSHRWRERYSLWQDIHTYVHIHTQQQQNSNTYIVNKSTNIMPVQKPRSPLGSYNPGASPMESDSGLDRSYTGKVGSRPGAVASNLELRQREEAPRGRKWPSWAPIQSPSISQHTRRGLMRLR
jgi:hypothetical protein